MTWLLQKASITDVGTLFLLDQRADNSNWTEGDIRNSINSGQLCYKLVDEGIIKGYCVVRLLGFELEILNLVISKKYQGKGLGYSLLDHVLSLPDFSDVTDVWLEVRQNNHGAICLYQKVGFVIVGERKNYYTKPIGRENALIMKLNINSGSTNN